MTPEQEDALLKKYPMPELKPGIECEDVEVYGNLFPWYVRFPLRLAWYTPIVRSVFARFWKNPFTYVVGISRVTSKIKR